MMPSRKMMSQFGNNALDWLGDQVRGSRQAGPTPIDLADARRRTLPHRSGMRGSASRTASAMWTKAVRPCHWPRGATLSLLPGIYRIDGVNGVYKALALGLYHLWPCGTAVRVPRSKRRVSGAAPVEASMSPAVRSLCPSQLKDLRVRGGAVLRSALGILSAEL